jgi:F1F0 ATPase subunit 2
MIADAGFLALGLVAGTLHFSLLRWNTIFYARPGRIGMGAALQLARLAVLAALLTMVARQGALPLLLTALGVLIARPIVVRRLGTER